MKFWNIIFGSTFFFFLISQNLAHADQLLGHKWAKDHPGLLPYDACIISYDAPYMTAKKIGKIREKGSMRQWAEARKFNIGYSMKPQMMTVSSKFGVGVESSPGEAYLYCTSRLLNLTFSLPIYIGKEKSLGLLINPFSIQKNMIEIGNLDGKTYGEVMGKYKGAKIGYTEVVGGTFNFAKNDAGVLIHSRKLMAGVGVEIGASFFEAKIPESVPQGICTTNQVITSNTTQIRELNDCMEEMAPVSVEDLSQLRFVKITRKNVEQYIDY